MIIFSYIKDEVSSVSRRKKEDHFYTHFTEGMSVLDVGVSKEENFHLQLENHFLKNFRYASKYYTGLGIENLSCMRQLYPDKRFVEYSGGRFPFDNKEFDWAYSNAVIEHVGDEDAQIMFLNEMIRVSKKVFFTTPFKFFPVETHTNVLFLHWQDDIFRSWCSKKHLWVSKYDPYLFSYSRLKNTLDKSMATNYKIFKNRFYGMVMTFTVICSE